MKKTTFALFVSNRVTFPQEIVNAAIAEVSAAVEKASFACLPPPFPVADEAEGRRFAAFLKEHEGEFDGIIAVFPNFGDESSTFTALRDAHVPILFQAYPDDPDRMGADFRRDAFCGKISAMNLFRQAGIPCTSFEPHTVHPSSSAFARNLRDFSAVCRIVNGMRRVRCGSLGARCTPFKTVRFDETALERYGITNEAYDLSALFAAYEKISDSDPALKSEIEAFRAHVRWPEEAEGALVRIAKFALVIERLIVDQALDLVTLRCWTELEEHFRFSPCVILSYLNGKGIAANCEVDTINALAMRALSLAAGEPAACLDWNNNFGDEPEKCVLFHCGPTAKVLLQDEGQRIADHPMFSRVLGAGCGFGCHEGRMRPGLFTCASGYTRGGKLVFYTDCGRFTEDRLPDNFFGVGGVAEFPGLQGKLRHLTKAGFPHHVSLCYGDFLEPVREAFGEYLGYGLTEL